MAPPSSSSLPPDTVAVTTPPLKRAQREKQLGSYGPTSLLGAVVLLFMAVPIWIILIVETLARAWKKGSLYAALAPPRDPDALENKRAPWPFPTREFTVAVESNKVRLACVELVATPSPPKEGEEQTATAAPTPDRRPLALFLHGFPEQPFSHRHIMPAVAAKGYRCVALTLRGYYPSDAPDGVAPYRLRRLANDVRDAAIALQQQQKHKAPVLLVAHDWGGSVAWAALALHRDLFTRAVILALPPIQLFSANASLAQALKSMYILRFQFPFLPEATLLEDDARVVGEVFSAKGIGCVSATVSEEEKAVFRHAFAQPGRATAALNYYRALMRWSLSRVVPGWVFGGSSSQHPYADDGLYEALRRPLDGTPVLLLHGDSDVALGTQLLDGWEAVCPHSQSRAYLLGRCSHWINQDRPEAVNELIGGWLPAVGSAK
jgi:pimeloyl-ACP methyl ester carboxylesterase